MYNFHENLSMYVTVDIITHTSCLLNSIIWRFFTVQSESGVVQVSQHVLKIFLLGPSVQLKHGLRMHEALGSVLSTKRIEIILK